MARPFDIDTIGKEAFDMLDENDRRNGRPPYRHHVDRRSQVPQMKEAVVLDCYEAAKMFGAVVVRDGRQKRPSMQEAVVLDCYEAAKLYGGVVVRDLRDGHQKRPSMWSF